MSVFKPSLFSHHKFLRLCDRVGLQALYHLARLWNHCEDGQRGDIWPQADANYVEAVATWNGNAGELFRHLVDLRWVDELPDGGVRIHGWVEVNRMLCHAWTARGKGPKPSGEHQVKVTRQSADNHLNVTRPSGEHQVKVTRQSPGSDLLKSSVLLSSTGSLSKGGTGGAGAPKSQSAHQNKKVPGAGVPSHVRYAAVEASIKELEAEETEQGHLSKEKKEQLKTLREHRREIRKQQTGVK